MLDRNNPRPLYAQFEDVLRTANLSGQWEVNHAIPSENELSRLYGLSRMTVRSVLTQLVREGLLFRVQGKGTFVAHSKISARSPAYMGIREQLEQMGYEISTRLIAFGQRPCGQEVGRMLGLDETSPVVFVERVRLAEGQPISIHRTYLPLSLCPALDAGDLVSEQLCTVVERDYGLKPAFVSESLESVLATQDEADLLQVERGSPLIMLQDCNKTAAGVLYEFSKILFRGDKLKLHFEYQA